MPNGEGFIGRSPDQLTLDERRQLVGRWIALEIYTPDNLALRKIEALGDSASDCMSQLASRGLDPRKFEYTPLTPAY